jgi:hypothetical protein
MNTSSTWIRAEICKELAALASLSAITEAQAERASRWVQSLDEAQMESLSDCAYGISEMADSIVHLSACSP